MSTIIPGIVFGLSGGLSPGPLLALVISETLNHGVWSGVRVALAPLLTDLPIVAAVLLVLAQVQRAEPVLGTISLAGAGFLGFLGLSGLAFRGADLELPAPRQRSLSKGVVTNLLNPNPYLFWLTIGGPTVVQAAQRGAAHVVAFVVAFYLLLVGSKIGVAVLVARARELLRSRAYVWLNRLLGLALLGFALHFLLDGLRYLGVISG